ncbi:MAG: hypothetical protein NWF06_03395 [Candidatus Bathyarchaeota archaeon]|nr:hypothetical protein [Candidatus Bathyarchaeum sp.]
METKIMSADDETYDEEEEETKLLNAEEVTLIATNFLKRLGNKQGLKPIKASLEEELYIVEVGLLKKIATVQIDATTEQIKEYEIKDKEQQEASSSFFPITPKNIMVLGATAAASIVISALLGIQSLLPF